MDFREKQQVYRIAESIEIAKGRKEFPVVKSTEEAVDLMKALMGFQTMVSNVNMPNLGQMPQMLLGSIVETNCVFSNDQIYPVMAKPLPVVAANLVYRNCVNIDTTYEGIKEQGWGKIYAVFTNQPLCNTLTMEQSKALLWEMCQNTRAYLDQYFDLDQYFYR